MWILFFWAMWLLGIIILLRMAIGFDYSSCGKYKELLVIAVGHHSYILV